VTQSKKRASFFKIIITGSHIGYHDNVAYIQATSKKNAEKQFKGFLKRSGITDIVKHNGTFGYSFASINRNGRVVFIEEIHHLNEKLDLIKELLEKDKRR